jgi:cobalt transporter subunit CbtB
MNSNHATVGAPPIDRSRVIAPAIVAALLGVFLVFGTGMAQIPAAHNAAHDTRHSLAFPCH